MDIMKCMEDQVKLIEAELKKFVPESIEPEVLARASKHLWKQEESD